MIIKCGKNDYCYNSVRQKKKKELFMMKNYLLYIYKLK